MQGVAHHMSIHGERLRSRFVSHQGKLELVFECRDWLEGSPENPWPEAFDSWAGQIREHVGPQLHDSLLCDFSTSGPVERTVSQIVMMDVFDRYFEYLACGICGLDNRALRGRPPVGSATPRRILRECADPGRGRLRRAPRLGFAGPSARAVGNSGRGVPQGPVTVVGSRSPSVPPLTGSRRRVRWPRPRTRSESRPEAPQKNHWHRTIRCRCRR